MKKSKVLEIIYILLGSIIVSFAVCTIHAKTQLTEGGEIGVELLLLHQFNFSPIFSSICIDFILYFLGFFILAKKFRLNALIGTLAYSISYFLFGKLNFSWFFINNLLISSIVGGILVGIGCGLVVKHIGSCGSDDSLALIINKLTKIPLFWCYFTGDMIVILISMTYIKSVVILYSILTSFISSFLIDCICKNSFVNNN